jgi:hypothetical protein
MNGKSSIWIALNVERKMRKFLGQVPGRAVTLSRPDEEVIRPPSEIKDRKDQRLEQFELRVLAAQIQQSSKHFLKPPLAIPNQTSSFAGGYWLRP